MKEALKNFIFNHIDKKHIITRIRGGKQDLKAALAKGTPITKEQEEEIRSFWKPFLNGLIEKQAFDIKWFDVYNKTNIFGHQLKHYIPDGYYYAIIDTFFNDPLRCKYMDDKNLYDLYFHDVNQAKTLCRKEGNIYLDENYNIISKQQAINICKDAGNVIIKPSVQTWAGAGIHKWSINSGENSDNNEGKLTKFLGAEHSLVVQELIKQHQCLAQFNDTCVNTLRLVTLYFAGKVEVVSAVVIMGGKGALTNHLHRGGLICGIHTDGSLFHTAFDGSLNQYKQHPCGTVFAGCSIHNYQKCVDMVTELAPRLFGMSKMTAWDITLDEAGEPLLIEANFEYGGVVQKAAGPVFGDKTEEILSYIQKCRKK